MKEILFPLTADSVFAKVLSTSSGRCGKFEARKAIHARGDKFEPTRFSNVPHSGGLRAQINAVAKCYAQVCGNGTILIPVDARISDTSRATGSREPNPPDIGFVGRLHRLWNGVNFEMISSVRTPPDMPGAEAEISISPGGLKLCVPRSSREQAAHKHRERPGKHFIVIAIA
jgi:hypothetical protein